MGPTLINFFLDFYDDTIDTTDFSLFYIECPIVGNGRGTVSGRIYKRDGTLAVLCVRQLSPLGGPGVQLTVVTFPTDTGRGRTRGTLDHFIIREMYDFHLQTQQRVSREDLF